MLEGMSISEVWEAEAELIVRFCVFLYLFMLTNIVAGKLGAILCIVLFAHVSECSGRQAVLMCLCLFTLSKFRKGRLDYIIADQAPSFLGTLAAYYIDKLQGTHLRLGYSRCSFPTCGSPFQLAGGDAPWTPTIFVFNPSFQFYV